MSFFYYQSLINLFCYHILKTRPLKYSNYTSMIKKIAILISIICSLYCSNASGSIIGLNCEKSKITYSLSKFGIPFKIKSLPTTGVMEFDVISSAGGEGCKSVLLKKFDIKANFTSKLQLFRKFIEYDKYPYFSFSSDIKKPILVESNKDIFIDGNVNFHGVSKKVFVKLSCTTEKGNIYFKGNLNIKMSDFGLTPPRILFITIDDLVKTRIELHSTDLPDTISYLLQ